MVLLMLHFKTKKYQQIMKKGNYLNLGDHQLQLSRIIPPATISHENSENGGLKEKLQLVPT